MSVKNDITGRKFGRLTVVKQVENGKYGRYWECKCECGNTIIRPTADLTRKKRPTRSCGCLQREIAIDLALKKKEQASRDLYELIQKAEGVIDDSYVSNTTKVNCKFGKVNIYSTPRSLTKQIIPSMLEFKKCLSENGDKFIEWIKFINKKGMVALIATFDGGRITIDVSNYKQFVKARKEFYDEVEKYGDIVLSPYLSSGENKILIDYRCGHKPHWVKPISYKINRSCPRCSGYCPEQAEEDFFDKLHVNGHILKSEYKGNFVKVLIDFGCGHEPHWITPAHYKSNVGCPKCSTSKGEKAIIEYLRKNGYKYEHKKRMDNNREYDVFIVDYNLFIEIHGRQHYEETNYFKRTLEEEIKNDKEKKEYVLSLGYNYIEIDYREHNPKFALERFKKQFAEFLKEN